MGALGDLARRMDVVFPVHPRTRQRLEEFGLNGAIPERLRLLAPLGYLETVAVVEQSTLVLTDSGGLQEETTVLGVPCLTARPNTERPITVTEGTNQLVPSERLAIGRAVDRVIADRAAGRYRGRQPAGWDGRAGERIVAVLTGVGAD
jgi:UDP-N-acetylglucosamine 2-epimerase (non-hydrolysing)